MPWRRLVLFAAIRGDHLCRDQHSCVPTAGADIATETLGGPIPGDPTRTARCDRSAHRLRRRRSTRRQPRWPSAVTGRATWRAQQSPCTDAPLRAASSACRTVSLLCPHLGHCRS
jgi:hypothetical protein